MVTMVTSPGSNVTCLNCEIVECSGIEQTRIVFFLFIVNLITFKSVE